MLRWMKYLAASATLAFLAACGSDDDDHEPVVQTPGNIAEVATDAGFSALVAAAQKANLVGALTAPNANLTVFAPTNAAFDSLATTLGFTDAGAMVAALPAEALAKVLTYHIVPGRKTAADIVAAGATSTQPTLYTFEGTAATLAVRTTGGVSITDEVLTTATVTTADVAASNGVIHVIDRVILPTLP